MSAKPRNYNYQFSDEVDPVLDIFYRPHNITILFLFIFGLLYVAFNANSDVITNSKVGLWAAFSVLLITGVLSFKDGPFIRPHPSVWRVVLALAVAYQMCLVLVLFQVLRINENKSDARLMFKFIDPSLGVALPEKNYAETCELTFENIYRQLDVFVLAHTFGWFCKALILRDYWLCWVISILFEVMEYSLEHQLANFAECWWDHWILDVLITNWLGIYIGMKTCEYFQVKHYSFKGINDIATYKGKLSRLGQQFTPHSFMKFEWGTTKKFSRYMAIIAIIILEILCELNAFYLKYLLWIPVSSRLNLWRLLYSFFLALPAVREAYQFITDPECKRLGMFSWFAAANIATEVLIIVKFARGEFLVPFPTNVIYFWAGFSSIFVVYTVWNFYLRPCKTPLNSLNENDENNENKQK